MTYSQLSIHQKINAKANAIILYWYCNPFVSLMQKIRNKDGDLYNPKRLLSGPFTFKEPRNAGKPDYDAPTIHEQQERQAKIQREVK